jgi:DNA-binding NtrC family response regulator
VQRNPHLSILLVDDEALIRWSLRQALLNRGHAVVTAASAAEALGAIADAAEPFDAVILDYRLPDRQDLSLLDDVRRESPGSVVFMMTAFGDEAMRSGARERGARAVVDKPFQVKQFATMVEDAVV